LRAFSCFDLTFPPQIIRTYSSYRNEVDVPEELKQSLLHSVKAVHECRGTHTDFLVEKKKERNSSIEQVEAVALLRELYKKVNAKPPNIELRIKNGSFTITNYYDDDGKASDVGDGPRRAKQKIRTVKTESPVFKLKNLLFSCAKGDLRMRKEKVVIMDQVNVVFEPGKMYLVL
jgi:hypothetical protein